MNGIPTLLNKISTVTDPIARITNALSLVFYDVQGIIGMFSPPEWGIFLDGEPVIVTDSILDLGYHKEAKISTYPQQKGAFETYNKVQTPFVFRIRMTKGGSDNERQKFLYSLEELQNTFDLFDIVMPEKVYNNVNIFGISFHRSSKNGVSLLVADVSCMEVMDTVKLYFTEAKKEQSNDPVNSGTVQPKPEGSDTQRIYLDITGGTR